MSTEVLLNEFKEYSEHPYRVLSEYKKQGKKVIGMLPYYAPAELVVAAGMVPMGIWGSNKKTIALAKEYCATFYWHHRPAGAGDAAGRHPGSAGRRHHPHHL